MVLILFIVCFLTELICSFMTPTNAPLIHTNTILYGSLIFGATYALRQDVKLQFKS
jgi:hypothetical protein